MTKTLTTFVTITALLIHAVLGCCAHHVHTATSCKRECQHATVAEWDSAEVSECGHTHSSNCGNAVCAECVDQPDEPKNHRHFPCDDISCKWLVSLSVSRWFSSDHHVLLAFVSADRSSQNGMRWNSLSVLAQTERRSIENARALSQVWRL